MQDVLPPCKLFHSAITSIISKEFGTSQGPKIDTEFDLRGLFLRNTLLTERHNTATWTYAMISLKRSQVVRAEARVSRSQRVVLSGTCLGTGSSTSTQFLLATCKGKTLAPKCMQGNGHRLDSAHLLCKSSSEQTPLPENMLGWVNHTLPDAAHWSRVWISSIPPPDVHINCHKSLFHLCDDFIQDAIYIRESLTGNFEKVSVSLDLNWGLLLFFFFTSLPKLWGSRIFSKRKSLYSWSLSTCPFAPGSFATPHL